MEKISRNSIGLDNFFESFFEVALAVPGYARGESGKRLLGDSLLGLILRTLLDLEE